VTEAPASEDEGVQALLVMAGMMTGDEPSDEPIIMVGGKRASKSFSTLLLALTLGDA
jgi:hypothetical protein